MAAKLCFAENTIKNSVFSRTQLLGITDSKPPFEAPFPKWHFCNQKCHFGFYPVPAGTPIFIVLRHLEWPQKRTIFQKQIVATKMRFLPSEHK